MNPDEPFKESKRKDGEHVWPPILAALAAIPDPTSKWLPFVLSDPPPEKVGEMWHKEKVVVFPPVEQRSSFLDREFICRLPPDTIIPPSHEPP